MTGMGDVSRLLGMNVTRDREEGTITINQKDYTEDIVQRYGIRGCNPAYTPGVRPGLSLDHQRRTSRTKKASGDTNHSRVRLCTLRRSAATASFISSTSW